jgi:uncharacterized membrane protein
MTTPDQQFTEARFEQLLGNLLRAGVVLSGAVVLLGGIVYLLRHGNEPFNLKVFHGEPTYLTSPSGIVQDATHLSGQGIIQLGMLLLIATPVARVVFSVFGFIRERDLGYVVITLIVLTVLLFSLFVGASF